MQTTITLTNKETNSLLVFCFCLATLATTLACAAAGTRGPVAEGPRITPADYPVLLAASEDRRKAALGAWTALTRAQGIENAPAPEFQPATTTVRSLPPLAAALRLPNIVVAEINRPVRGKSEAREAPGVLTEEEATRESLRRFLASLAPLLGVETEDVSLVSIKDEQNNTKRAVYEQKPFLVPLRGGYGRIEISFTDDRRVVALTSTAIPDAERLRTRLALPRERLTAQQAAASLAGASYTYTDANGIQQTRTVADANAISIRELVVLPMERAGEQPTLEFHLAWEAVVGNDSPQVIYVDAVTGEILRAGN
ncbi:MAG: hypothetical protein H0V88_09375 [Pyrinomonadaceae bacterium]|nr:hypothetical protein [Pyrinomonadaceae bacterium]